MTYICTPSPHIYCILPNEPASQRCFLLATILCSDIMLDPIYVYVVSYIMRYYCCWYTLKKCGIDILYIAQRFSQV